MRIALFGGAFDPVHLGHLRLADLARKAFDLDRVVFVPTGHPPHKHPAVASALDRLRMLRRAIAGHRALRVSDWEIRQKRVVYSFETIAHFRARWPKAALFFIVGTDSLRDLPRWKKGLALLNACVFLAAERPGIPWSRIPASIRQSARRIPWRALPWASREIRARVKKGKSIRDQVPESVKRYIKQKGLYR